MPFKSDHNRREYQRTYQREYRRKRRALGKAPVVMVPVMTDDPIGDLATWSESTLRVPPGHPLAGQPLRVPDYGLEFLRDALKHRYSLLSVSRKNAKSAIIAVYLLSRLAGPLRIDGWRGGVCSVNREKALELKRQIEGIVKASGLESEVTVWKSPTVETSTGRLDILSADKNAGAASGFDDAIVDELGLLCERDRELVNGMRSAIAARDGRFIALSIMGKGPFCREMAEQRNDPSVCVHLYQTDEGAALDDENGWHQSNPGLTCGIKSLSYLRDESRRVMRIPSDQNDFRAQELNQSVDPEAEAICSADDFAACVGDVPRDGRVVVGFDLGGSSSMSAFVAYWPGSGRVEVYAAFGDDPDLLARGQADGVNDLYVRLHAAGDLWTYPGKLTPVSQFLGDCFARLSGQTVIVSGADRFRRAEAETALQQAGIRTLMEWRGQGASAVADGSHDVRAFQRLVIQGRLRVSRGAALLAHAVRESRLRHDVSGNPALDKSRCKGRIDCLQAAVIAAGLGERAAVQSVQEELGGALAVIG